MGILQGTTTAGPALLRGVDLKPHKTIGIAVSGDVLLNKLEIEIIDTPQFQRLRRIKQLGTAYLVYPTAVQSRFDHSIGTLSMACRMMRAIEENEHNEKDERSISNEEKQFIRLLALLHDITHIPFGHTIEDEAHVLERHDENDTRMDRFVGEGSRIGAIIIKHLGQDLYSRFWQIFSCKKKEVSGLADDAFMYDIVNNTICADLLDYIKRDSYFCNLELDTAYRFLKYLYIGRIKSPSSRRVMIRLWKGAEKRPRKDLLSEMVRLLDNRYFLAERVYFHHAKLASSAMIGRAMQSALRSNEVTESSLCEIGDEELLCKLRESRQSDAKAIGTALLNRELWKEIDQFSTEDVLHAPHRDPGQIHLDHRLLHRALPPALPDDCAQPTQNES